MNELLEGCVGCGEGDVGVAWVCVPAAHVSLYAGGDGADGGG